MSSNTKVAAVVCAAFALSLGVVGAVVLLANGQNRPQSSRPASAAGQPVLTVQGFGLLRDFQDNEIAANQKYKGKVIKVGGHVISVSPGTVFLRVAEGREAPRAPSIICHIAPEVANEFATFRSGQGVYIVGLCEGASRYKGVPGYGELVVTLANCRPASGGTSPR